jgi:hypothetical protein
MPKHDGHTLNRKCVDCGAPVTKQATRCKPCAKVVLVERMKKLALSRKGIPILYQTEKICRNCKKLLPIENFYKASSKKTYYQSDCKDCNTQIRRDYVTQHRDKINQYNIKFNHESGRSKYYGQGKRPKLNRPRKLGYKIYCPTWDDLKKWIYKRDNWTCQECGTHCHSKGEIQCHHIDYNTGNNLSINLITLCRKCHCPTNFDREFWQFYFENKILLIVER